MFLCKKCGETNPDSFYGYLRGECKQCVRERVKLRARNDPNVREYDRQRSRTPERLAYNRQNSANYREKYPGKHAENNRDYRKRNPDKSKAHNALNNALRDGKIAKGACSICGATTGVQAHHSDYSMPLDVVWYCPIHHKSLHHRKYADGVI